MKYRMINYWKLNINLEIKLNIIEYHSKKHWCEQMKYGLLGCCLSVLEGVRFLSQPVGITNVVTESEEKIIYHTFLHSIKKY